MYFSGVWAYITGYYVKYLVLVLFVYMHNKRMAQPNYIIIERGNIRVRMVHFQKGSIKVKAGDNVKEGQLIWLVGDSGLSFEPHLHMHVMQNGYGAKFMLNGKCSNSDCKALACV
jgi:murein DD-endopeptidase MepM/ murein hydrolase activator NlpD